MKMLGRLGWRGQCGCCNGPKGKKAIRAEEKLRWRREAATGWDCTGAADCACPGRHAWMPSDHGGVPVEMLLVVLVFVALFALVVVL